MSSSLQLVGLGHRYGDRPLFRGVDLTFSGPGVLGLVGPNGAGKTSLLRIVAQLLDPWEGHIELNGRRVASDDIEARAQTSYVAHDAVGRRTRSVASHLN